MGGGKRVEKKEISAGTTVKAVITGYIAYGILIGFIAFMIGLVINWCVSQITTANHRVLSITLPILGVFCLFFAMHGICKLSIYDVFKKCKTNPDKIEKIHTRLNLFLLICIGVSVVAIIMMLILNFSSQRRAIIVASYQYNAIHSQQFATELTNEMIQNYEEQKANTIISTIILELGITLSYFSLIPYQRKMIERYNDF